MPLFLTESPARSGGVVEPAFEPQAEIAPFQPKDRGFNLGPLFREFEQKSAAGFLVKRKQLVCGCGRVQPHYSATIRQVGNRCVDAIPGIAETYDRRAV